jgi:hypothetical protein
MSTSSQPSFSFRKSLQSIFRVHDETSESAFSYSGVGVGVIHYPDLSPLPGYAGNYSGYNYFSLERANYLQVSGSFTNHLVELTSSALLRLMLLVDWDPFSVVTLLMNLFVSSGNSSTASSSFAAILHLSLTVACRIGIRFFCAHALSVRSLLYDSSWKAFYPTPFTAKKNRMSFILLHRYLAHKRPLPLRPKHGKSLSLKVNLVPLPPI